MSRISGWLETVDRFLTCGMRRFGHITLRLALGVIFIWFGLLKPFGASAANDIIARTVYWFDPAVFIPILGWWEVAIGICLLFRPLIRLALILLFFQIWGTFLPLILLPEACFEKIPFVLTIEGQYIVKNIVIIAGAMVVGGTVRMTPQEKNQKMV